MACMTVMLGVSCWFYSLMSQTTSPPPTSTPTEASTQLRGKASFYSKRWTGRRTSSGETLHHDSMTCAHRSYAFGTLLKVTNLMNGKQVVVRVNDRGPFHRGRIIDLSWGAAKAIDMIAQGITPVTVEKVTPTPIPLKPEDPPLPHIEFNIADMEPW